MKSIANLVKRIIAVVSKPRIMHYVDIFLAGTATALYWNRDQLLGAHGLNIVGSVVFGAAVAGLKAVFEAFRKNFNLPDLPAADPAASTPAPPPPPPPPQQQVS